MSVTGPLKDEADESDGPTRVGEIGLAQHQKGPLKTYVRHLSHVLVLDAKVEEEASKL